MRKRTRHSFVTWALITALLNLALTMAPGAMAVAAMAAPSARAVGQMSPDAVSCHEAEAALAALDQGQPASDACPDGSCNNDHCPWCAQPATGLTRPDAGLVPLREFFLEMSHPRLAGFAPGLILPPPRALRA